MLDCWGVPTDTFYSIKKLKEKLSSQRKHLDELESHIKEMEAEKRGEQ
jgi:cell division protein FtsL